MDPTSLAITVVGTFLMPYIKVGAEKIAEEVSGNLGKAAADHVTEVTKKVWERVKSVFSSDEDQVVLEQFEKRPDAFKEPVTVLLKEKLEQDDQLAQELSQLINTPDPSGAGGSVQIMQAGVAAVVTVHSSTFSGPTNITGLNYGSSSTEPPTPSNE